MRPLSEDSGEKPAAASGPTSTKPMTTMNSRLCLHQRLTNVMKPRWDFTIERAVESARRP